MIELARKDSQPFFVFHRGKQRSLSVTNSLRMVVDGATKIYVHDYSNHAVAGRSIGYVDFGEGLVWVKKGQKGEHGDFVYQGHSSA